jgi:pyruvate dehydrogenase E2 component (dihydrolipoamide acetyltransferase)
MEVLVPDLGEFADVEIIEILKSVGDTVQSEDPLIVLETPA